MAQIKFSAKIFPLSLWLGLMLSPLSLGQSIAQESVDEMSVGQDSSIAAVNAFAIQYYQGDGKPKDYSKAAELFQKAADRGSAMAQFNLGYMHEKGIGLPSDYSKAYVYYQAAAGQGHTVALEHLEHLRQFMSAEKITELEKIPPQINATSSEASLLSDKSPVANQTELRSWLQSIKPAAGRKK